MYGNTLETAILLQGQTTKTEIGILRVLIPPNVSIWSHNKTPYRSLSAHKVKKGFGPFLYLTTGQLPPHLSTKCTGPPVYGETLEISFIMTPIGEKAKTVFGPLT